MGSGVSPGALRGGRSPRARLGCALSRMASATCSARSASVWLRMMQQGSAYAVCKRLTPHANVCTTLCVKSTQMKTKVIRSIEWSSCNEMAGDIGIDA